MKKTKLLLSVLVSLLLVVVMAFAVTACKTNGDTTPDPEAPGKTAEELGLDDQSEETLALQSLSVSGGKTNFKPGDKFSTGSLSVRATYIDTSVEVTSEDPEANIKLEILEASQYEVDSSEFVSEPGTYSIYVSHTHAGVTRTASYTVRVTAREPEIGGIIAKLVGNDEYELSATEKEVTISKDIVEVYEVVEGENGVATWDENSPLAADKYEAQLYLGANEIAGNKASANGVYSLRITLVEKEVAPASIPVYVTNPVVKIELDENENSVFEQESASKDSISGTWVFTVTYANETTKSVTVEDAGVTLDIDTKTAGSRQATVTYTEATPKGDGTTSAYCKVDYKITAKVVEGAVTYTLGYTAHQTNSTDNTGEFVSAYVGDEDLSSNVTITNTATAFKTSSKSTEGGSENLSDYAEIKQYGSKHIEITVGAKATNVTIAAYVSHTSNDARTIYLATATTADDLSKVIDSKTVGGDDGLNKSNLHILGGEGLGAGTYYIYTNSTTVHVYQVLVTYTVENENGGGTQGTNIKVTANDIYEQFGTQLAAYNEADAGTDFSLEIAEGITVIGAIRFNANNHTADDGQEYNYRLQLRGAGSTTKRCLKFEVGAGAKITVYVRNSGSDNRTFDFYDSSATKLTDNSAGLDKSAAAAYSYEVTGAGTYYAWGSNGLDVIYISVEY